MGQTTPGNTFSAALFKLNNLEKFRGLRRKNNHEAFKKHALHENDRFFTELIWGPLDIWGV